MDCISIIRDYYDPNCLSYRIIMEHGRHVAEKAIAAASRVRHLKPNIEFIWEAAFLHDIGIYLTDAPSIGCRGDHPYICHGVLGRKLLESRGLFRHALVCERHTGVGLSAEDIRSQNLPLPDRDMVPLSVEEQIICYADKFFSKSAHSQVREKSIRDIIDSLERFGPEKAEQFLSWSRLFG